MVDWINQNSEMLQVLLNALMVVIWIAYLQIFYISFRRQQRSKILINMGVGSGLNARCFISNLSLEPLYLHDVVVELSTKDGTREAVITDRAEMKEEQITSLTLGTNQGPLNSGESIDIGSFNDIIERASKKLEGVWAGCRHPCRCQRTLNSKTRCYTAARQLRAKSALVTELHGRHGRTDLQFTSH